MTCGCGMPGGYHGDSCKGVAARIALNRVLEARDNENIAAMGRAVDRAFMADTPPVERPVCLEDPRDHFGNGPCVAAELPSPIHTEFQSLWDVCQAELRDLRQKLILSAQEAARGATELTRAQEEAKFWKRSCEAQGRDLAKVLLRLQELGEVPIP